MYGYWVDLLGQQLAETSWVHALPIGKYDHPVYGAMDFTTEKINNFALSVKQKTRGIDLDIDYDHKQDPAKGDKAAGWIKDAEVRTDGLYLNVNWTPSAAQALKDGEYRYFSPEFDDEWTDPQGLKHTDILFGGALTNRPFLKDLMPVNLSEIMSQGGKVAPTPTPPTPTPVPPTNQPPAPPVALSEDALTKLLTDHPLFKELKEGLAATQTQLAESERTRRLAEVKHRLSTLRTKNQGRDYVLPPSVIEAVAEGTISGDPVKMSESFLGALETLAKVGYVELGERGRMQANSGQEKDATTQLSQAVLTARTAHFQATGKQLSYTDAMRYVVANSPELYEEYRQDSYAGKED
jgi:hypothetical protein